MAPALARMPTDPLVKALSVADRGYVLELGCNRFTGAGRELLNDPEVKRLYLGG